MRQVGHVCCLWNHERRQLGDQEKRDGKSRERERKKELDTYEIGVKTKIPKLRQKYFLCKTAYLEWKMWLQGSFLAPVTISSRQIIQTLSEA